MNTLIIIIGLALLYCSVIVFIYALLGAARRADDYAEYQYERDFGRYESR